MVNTDQVLLKYFSEKKIYYSNGILINYYGSNPITITYINFVNKSIPVSDKCIISSSTDIFFPVFDNIYSPSVIIIYIPRSNNYLIFPRATRCSSVDQRHLNSFMQQTSTISLFNFHCNSDATFHIYSCETLILLLEKIGPK